MPGHVRAVRRGSPKRACELWGFAADDRAAVSALSAAKKSPWGENCSSRKPPSGRSAPTGGTAAGASPRPTKKGTHGGFVGEMFRLPHLAAAKPPSGREGDRVSGGRSHRVGKMEKEENVFFC